MRPDRCSLSARSKAELILLRPAAREKQDQLAGIGKEAAQPIVLVAFQRSGGIFRVVSADPAGQIIEILFSGFPFQAVDR